MQAYSRWLHRNAPPNRYLRVKVPYKTIAMAVIFFIVGTIMLYLGICTMMEQGTWSQEAWEKLVLGGILFIPGSFHTFLAI